MSEPAAEHTPPTPARAGPLPHRRRAGGRVRRRAGRRLARRLRVLLLPVLTLGMLGGALATVGWRAGVWQSTAVRALAPGEQYDGDPLPERHPLVRHHALALRDAAAPLDDAASGAAASPPARSASTSTGISTSAPDDTLALRRSCVWGKPGGNPYRGSVEQALRSAALPEEVVQAVAAQVRAGQAVDRLVIANDGVRALGSGRVFDPKNIAMTYGRTLCLSTRVNFVPGHTERAALYEASTAGGRVVAVMVPEVCGNVSVLGQAADARRGRVLTGGQTAAADAVRWMPAVLDGERAQGAFGLRSAAVQDVPEPGTLACALAALGLLGLLRWSRRHHRPRCERR